jgi:hypothetical protein
MKKYMLFIFVFIWVWMRFSNLTDLTKFLNTLPPGQKLSAKIACEPLAHSLLCNWYLVYEKEG